jgi:cell division protease FtsH
VAGADEAKAELQEVVDFLQDPKRFHKLGAKVPKGILLHGPPGTGKTLLAKAVANESGAQFFAQSASSFVEMYAGLGAKRIRRLFHEARQHAPAIVFIDEIDAVGAVRGSDNNSEREQTLNQLLVEMDGFDTSGDLVVIAASNLLDKLDPALLRPGRFDRQIFVSPPDVVGRKAILDVHTSNKPLAKDVDFEVIARQTSGLTGAELANICNEAAIAAARGLRPRVEHADFEYALERVVAGMETRHTLNERERRIVAFHEAGHALLAELLPGTTRTHRVSIVPRGTALGYVLHLPEEDRYLDTRAELMDELVVLLGGRAAEQLVFGSITSGASNDLFKVAAITRRMIHEWAMGTSVSAIQLIAEGGQVSDRTRELRDAEQQHLADEAMRRAVRLITDYRAQLDQLASALLRQEVLEREDIERIMAGVKVPGAAPGPLRIAAAEGS